MQTPTRDDVLAAATRIADIVTRTPLLRSDALDEATGARVWVKAENLQGGGAFKLRGAMSKISALTADDRKNGVLAFSSGNHAIAVAMVAKYFGIPAVIAMPGDAPLAKANKVRALGAEIIAYDRVRDDRDAIFTQLARDRALPLVKPFDDPLVMAGQGTIGLEIAAEIVPDIVLAGASGGGLAGGIAIALPDARVFAVEPEGHDDLARSLAKGEIVANAPGVRSICDALMADKPSTLTFAVAQRHLAGAITASDETAKRAMRFAFQELKLVLEPSGALALGALLDGAVDARRKTVVVVASGGNVDAAQFARIIDAQ
ncbi:MAG: threonine/serine dehydratase [Caulobacterales bacterium]